MAKCLRCGAGAEWISGRVKPEPADDAGLEELLREARALLRDSAYDPEGAAMAPSEWLERYQALMAADKRKSSVEVG